MIDHEIDEDANGDTDRLDPGIEILHTGVFHPARFQCRFFLLNLEETIGDCGWVVRKFFCFDSGLELGFSPLFALSQLLDTLLITDNLRAPLETLHGCGYPTHPKDGLLEQPFRLLAFSSIFLWSGLLPPSKW